jgi:hypothetical protein
VTSLKQTVVADRQPTPQQTEADKKLEQTRAEVDQVVDIMRNNVANMLNRGDKLSELAERAEAIQDQSSLFRHKAIRLKKTSRLRYYGTISAIVFAFVILVAILIYFIPWSYLFGLLSTNYQQLPERRSKTVPSGGPVSALSLSSARFRLNVVDSDVDNDLYVDGWIKGKPSRVIIDTGATVSIARPDIVAGLPVRETRRSYFLKMASGQTIPIDKEALVDLTLGRCALNIWVFIADITDDFILGMDVLRAYDALVDVKHDALRLGGETCQ